MAQTTLESIADSILKQFTTKSVTVSVSSGTITTQHIAVAEVMIVLAVTGSITVNGTVFVATAGIPYTFKHIADLSLVTIQGSAAAVIYYPAFTQFPNITPNNV